MATANFTLPGLRPPGAQEMEAAALQEALLAKQLASQQEGLMPKPADAGRYKALDLSGLANAILAQRTKAQQEVTQRKKADLQGEYQRGLVEALNRLNVEDPDSVREGTRSPYPEVQKQATEAQKNLEERARALFPRASLPSIQQAGGDYRKFQPKPDRTVSNGAVFDLTENQDPTVVAGKRVDERLPNGALAQRNPLTNELDLVDKVPKTTVSVTPVMKGESAYLEAEGKDISKVGSELRMSVPTQLAALDRAAQSAQAGAFQGPVAQYIQLAAGLAKQFGVADDKLAGMLKNTETLNSDMGRFVLQSIKALGYNPSNADREYAERTAGGQKLSKEGLLAVIQAAKQDIGLTVKAHNDRVRRMKGQIPAVESAIIDLPGQEESSNVDDLLKKYPPRPR